jgi:hypothetical protein
MTKDRTRSRIAIVALLAIIASMTAGFAIASADVTGSDGSVFACYRPTNGKLRLEVTACKVGKKEVRIRLNEPAEPPQSYKASSTSGVILSSDEKNPAIVVSKAPIQAGTYVVTASTTVKNEEDVPSLAGCRIEASTGDRGAYQATGLGTDTWTRYDSLTVTGRLTLTSAGTLSLACAELSTAPHLVWANIFPTVGEGVLTAVRVKP